MDADARRMTEHTEMKAMIAAPLRVGERVTGVIALGSTMPMPYTAGELKLLNPLALQTATAIDRTMASIDAFAGDAPQFDDITLLMARRT